MALIVEDGSIVAGAESYVTEAEADTYFTNRNNAAWAASTPAKEAALREAAQYLDGVFQFIGLPTNPDQVMSWPRDPGYDHQGRTIDTDEIPERLKQAQFELALQSVSGSLLAPYDRETQSEKVGSLQVTYFRGNAVKSYPFVTVILRDIIQSAGKLTRA